MKQFNRIPRPLRIMLPAVFVGGCITINALAIAEISRAPQVRSFFANTFRTNQTQTDTAQTGKTQTSRPTEAPSKTTEPDAAASGTSSPPINPSANLEEAKAKRDGTSVSKTLTTTGPELDAERPPVLNPRPKYGHYPYLEGTPDSMRLVAGYSEGETHRDETLHPDAAAALFKMISAARSDGIWLVAASGFRTLAQQRTLFSDQVAAKGSPEAAAKVSAPPGYSEHHTGYAIDLADGTLDQGDDITLSFADTPAYSWLLINAAGFGFELSFPENNAQGISFEPWHWRFVGTPEARALFSSASSPSQPLP